MTYQNPFSTLRPFEYVLWISSLLVVSLSFGLSSERDALTYVTTLIGVTALIFLAKGDVLGQGLCILFSVLYAVISWKQQYYGEVITYLGMTAPIACLAVLSWLRHPSKSGHNEVEVAHVKPVSWVILSVLTVLVTTIFYFILAYFNTQNLLPSTLSVATSFLAASLTFLRSPYYGLGYAANDVVLILLWSLASMRDPKSLPMIFCFVAFLVNDLYGFFNWRHIRNKQESI